MAVAPKPTISMGAVGIGMTEPRAMRRVEVVG